MGHQVEHTVIPARFIMTVGHFLLVLLAFQLKNDNIDAAFGNEPSVSELSKAEYSFNWCMAIMMICFSIDFMGIFGGFTIFFQKCNVIQIICHFFGGIYMSWYLTHRWQYQYLWQIVIWCNLLPSLCDLVVLFAVFVLQIVVF